MEGMLILTYLDHSFEDCNSNFKTVLKHSIRYSKNMNWFSLLKIFTTGSKKTILTIGIISVCLPSEGFLLESSIPWSKPKLWEFFWRSFCKTKFLFATWLPRRQKEESWTIIFEVFETSLTTFCGIMMMILIDCFITHSFFISCSVFLRKMFLTLSLKRVLYTCSKIDWLKIIAFKSICCQELAEERRFNWCITCTYGDNRRLTEI